jgi:GNAT superfamily N-acetyltransferase
MLDRSVPYHRIVMQRDPGTPLPSHGLPEGFSFVFYQNDTHRCERAWAEIEASVGEFTSEMDALLYFQAMFSPFAEEGKRFIPEPQRRMVFVVAPDGAYIGTATAWWGYVDGKRRPQLHWVAVKPGYQGLGIGKALVAYVVSLMLNIDGDNTFYLGTQTWSHTAVFIYEWAGFYISDEQNMLGLRNGEYKEAMAVIDTLRKKRN